MSPGAELLPRLEGRAALDWARAAGWDRADSAARTAHEAPRPDLVRSILAAVREGGDAELRRLAARFDGGEPSVLRVPAERCREALDRLDSGYRSALELARDNIARVHEAQRRMEAVVEVRPGVHTWREFRPIRRVGVYVPGGQAAYPSSLLMTAVPARIAGCAEVVACSPAGASGEPAETVLAAAALAGVDEFYAVGGAHAIGALAYGTETIAPVDKIFGPGGAWVNAAKLAVFDVVAIDLPAGPSEIVVWADDASDPERIAAELAAQAEHGADSRCAVVLTDAALVGQVRACLAARLAVLPPPRRAAATASLRRGAMIVVKNTAEAAGWIDAVAPEHLAILGAAPERRLALVSNAGAAFLGDTSPVAAGDYCTGANHVLPTGGRARGSGGLDVDAFGRWMSVQQLSETGLTALAPAIVTLAEREGLPGHAASVRNGGVSR